MTIKPKFKLKFGKKSIFLVVVIAVFAAFLMLSSLYTPTSSGVGNSYSGYASTNASYHYYQTNNSYNPTAAVAYAEMVHQKYFHTQTYPAGNNKSIFQKNLDYYNSEDCAHYVSEALIAGGLTDLGLVGAGYPGDNLTNYQSGFPGSYGIVGAYRLADYLAGYDLPIFPNNATAERIMGYYPIPASYLGSPHASIYYVTNYSMMPSSFLSPGDVIIDGGAGSGHAMMYIGNGTVLQTDPAAQWQYSPAVDQNISFYSWLTLHGNNVSAIYIHMPTYTSTKQVKITGFSGKTFLNHSKETLSTGTVKLIGSFPDGVGYGNYSYIWMDNGKVVSISQVTTLNLTRGQNNVTLEATGSNGTATATMLVNYEPQQGLVLLGISAPLSYVIVAVPVVIAAAVAVYAVKRK